MASSDKSDLYCLDITLPPGEAARHVAIAETAHILTYVADARLTVGTRVHELRKYTKRLRALFRLIRTGFPHFQQASGPIRTHPCQYDSYGIYPCVFGSGMKKHINGRSLMAHQRTVLHRNAIFGSTSPEKHVLVPRGNECTPRNH